MKKNFHHRPIIILLLISSFFLIEIIWIMHLYQAGKKDFRNKINQSIQSAITEEIYAKKEKEPRIFADFTRKDKVTIRYKVRDKYFQTDTTSKVTTILLQRMLYDFYKDSWQLDSMAGHLQHFITDFPLQVIFIRKNSEEEVMERYPEYAVPHGLPAFSSGPLGNAETDYIEAWYDFPLAYFWKSQKYGLLISLLPLFLAIYYGILILKKEHTERENLHFLEKQTIFIHDLKTPLCTNRDIENRILKNLYNWPLEKIQEKLKISRQQAKRLLTEMQKVTLQSAGRWGGEIENQTFNLKKALEELIYNRQCGNENSHITLDFQLEDPEIFADPFHLVHMVDNLISNALKHAGENADICINCSCNKHYRLIISVKDNGPGIPRHIRKYIFRPGFHKDSRYTENHGIGLPYIRKIVRQYGGYIHINSQENKGTEFILALNPARPVKKTTLSTHVYYYFFITLLLAEIIWLFNLYHTERTSFAHHQKPLIEEALFKVNKTLIHLHDTAWFRNNWQEKTITVKRGLKDTTIPMGTTVHQSHIYQRLAYDLRASHWRLDSIGPRYQTTKSPAPLFLKRTDKNGQTIDYYPSEKTGSLMPVIFHLPLGYVEGHRLEVQLAFPWTQPLGSYKGWLLLALATTLLSGWFTRILLSLNFRQQALVHFQREKVQHFIRELQTQLQNVLSAEINISFSPEYSKTEPHFQFLHGNIKQYENMLGKINYLLDQLMMIQTRRLILE